MACSHRWCDVDGGHFCSHAFLVFMPTNVLQMVCARPPEDVQTCHRLVMPCKCQVCPNAYMVD